MTRPKFDIQDGDFALTSEAAAVLANVSVQSLNLWKKKQNPPPRNEDGTYSARNFGKWLVDHRAAAGSRSPTKEPQSATYKDVETRLKTAQAEKVERENLVAEGELVGREETVTGWQTILMRVRQRLLKLPTSLAPQIAGLTEMAEVQKILKDGVNEALLELSSDDE